MCVCLHTNGPLNRERERRAFFFFFHDISGIRLMALGSLDQIQKKREKRGLCQVPTRYMKAQLVSPAILSKKIH